jgi:hypothetical protein
MAEYTANQKRLKAMRAENEDLDEMYDAESSDSGEKTEGAKQDTESDRDNDTSEEDTSGRRRTNRRRRLLL